MDKLTLLEDEMEKVYEKKLLFSQEYIHDLTFKFQQVFKEKLKRRI